MLSRIPAWRAVLVVAGSVLMAGILSGQVTAGAAKPSLVRAPFSEVKAKQAQRAWAEYLGRQVEETVNLGGGVTMDFVLIPPGTFTMGAPKREIDQILEQDKRAKREWFADQEQHEVTITRPFYLGKCMVTRGQFRQFTREVEYQTEAERDGLGGWGNDETARKFKGPKFNAKTGERSGGEKTTYNWTDPGFAQTEAHPVVNVSWNDADAFCRWLARRSGRGARLPSEAEWEYACRAGTMTRYHFGDDAEDLARYANVADGTAKKNYPRWTTIAAEDGYVYTAPVGSFRPNAFGLFDMHGNVSQWCNDWYGPYDDLETKDPLRVSRGEYSARVSRGSSWNSFAWLCRAANRARDAPAFRNFTLGFRVAFRLD